MKREWMKRECMELQWTKRTVKRKHNHGEVISKDELSNGSKNQDESTKDDVASTVNSLSESITSLNRVHPTCSRHQGYPGGSGYLANQEGP